jgi:hypothetical protein
MAIKEINEWDLVPDDNIFTPAEGGFPELMLRSGFNDAMRVHLSEMRRYYNEPEWIKPRSQGPEAADTGTFNRLTANTFTITISGPDQDVSAYFTDGRLIKVVDGSGTGTDLVTQCNGNATYSAGVTTVTTDLAMHADSSDGYAYFSSIARLLSTLDTNQSFFIPLTNNSAGIQTAVDEASAAGGGTVFLTHANYDITATITIDGSKGDIVFLGSGPATVLKQITGSHLDEMFLIDNNLREVSFRNLYLNVNYSTNGAGNGYGIRVEDCSTFRIGEVEFNDATRSIYFSGTNEAEINIHACRFLNFSEFGVSSNLPADTHRGIITDCYFNGANMSFTDPAGIKVAGFWTIVGNFMEGMGHASLLPRGVWLWNETSTNNGGHLCVVSGNIIAVNNAANGRAIESGGRSNAITGNTLTALTSGVCVFIISTTGGQFIDSNIVSGNTMYGGTGVQANDKVVDALIDGNNIRGATIAGIVIDGSNTVRVSNNLIADSVDGIQVKNSADNCHIDNNSMYDLSGTGVEIGAATDTLVTGNKTTNCVADFTDSGTKTRRQHNTWDSDTAWSSQSSSTSGTAEQDLATITALNMPNGGKVGTYIWNVSGYIVTPVNDQITFKLYAGVNGTKADTLIATTARWFKAFGGHYGNSEIAFTIDNDAYSKWGVSIQRSEGSGQTYEFQSSIRKASMQ